MPPQDHKPDDLDKVPGRGEPPQEAGEFTRTFGGRAEPVKRETDSSPEDTLSATPGSLTQLLGGKSKQPSPPPPDKLDRPPLAVPNTPESRPADSFTKAFDGDNAFSRDPANLGERATHKESGRQPRPDATPTESPGSFTRLFGSGEGVSTPAGTGERPQPPVARDPRQSREQSRGGLPSFSQVESAPDRNIPPRPPEIEPGSFTEAFRSQSASKPPESKIQPGSFTEEFGSSPSWTGPEPVPPSRTTRPYPSRPGAAVPAHNVEPLLPSNPQRPSAPAGGFTRLIDTLRPDPAPPSDATSASMRPGRPTEYPIADPNYAPRGSGSEHGATVVFNPSGQPEPEVAAPRGKSEYTMVVERSRLRPPVEVPGTAGSPSAGSPYGAGASAAPPSPPQYPQFAPPAAPVWTPPPAPAPPPWQPPPLAAPVMPQAPAFAAPALPVQPSSLGDKLVSFLPFMLVLTVINFLGLLAVLIILFATRK